MVSRPLTSAPGVNGAASCTPNNALNCATSVRARQTRERGASRVTTFSMRSVDVEADAAALGMKLTFGLRDRCRDGAAARQAARYAYPRVVRSRGASRRRARADAG